jgi:ribonucleoside-diphosphate reductase alpha chain
MTTMAIAPTTSSSFILGQVSPSIEPLNSNYFTKDLAKGKFTYKNPYLEKLLEDKNKNTQTTWKSILRKGGSVQHLDFLSDQEKSVFKTFGEISSERNCHSGFSASETYRPRPKPKSHGIPEMPPKTSERASYFWMGAGIKSFYYQRSANPSQELARSILNCSSCEG